MGRTRDEITPEIARFCERQHLFFVATAPSEGGHINLSPKGYDSFRVLDPNTVAYLDLTGSGVETIAHLRDNGRITVMFCAFEGAPNILRLYGTGQVLMPGEPGHDDLAQQFPDHPGARAIIRIDVTRVSNTCGYSVPFMDYVGERDRLKEWAGAKTDDQLHQYRAQKNAVSIDALPGLPGLDG